MDRALIACRDSSAVPIQFCLCHLLSRAGHVAVRCLAATPFLTSACVAHYCSILYLFTPRTFPAHIPVVV